jgi:hypothetical protein
MSDLSDFFTRAGLVFETIDGDGVTSAFTTELPDGEEHVFDLFVLPLRDSFEDEYVRFTVVPYIEQPYNGYPPDLYITVGQINHDLPQLKFAFDGDGDLELVFDIRADRLDYDQFQRALRLLVDYASTFYPRLKSLIGD